jgi:DnaJ-class molecular chaperone
MQIEVKPGYSEENILVFDNRGHEEHANVTSKLIVNFKQTPHDSFKRKGNDLYYTQRLTLEQAILSHPISIKTLDGRTILVTLD